LLVPLVAAQKHRINIQDNAPIIEQPVVYELSDVELGFE
jgi:hypothetical protein